MTAEGEFQYSLHSLAGEIDGFCLEIDRLTCVECVDTINYIYKDNMLFVVRARAAVRSLQNTACSATNTFILSLSEASISCKAFHTVQTDKVNDAELLHLWVKRVKSSIESGCKSIGGFYLLCTKLEAFCVKLERLCAENIDQIEMNNRKLMSESVATIPMSEVGLMVGSVLAIATVTTALLQSLQIPNHSAIGAMIIAIGGVIVYSRIVRMESNSVSLPYNKTFECLKATRTAINSFHKIVKDFQKIQKEPVALTDNILLQIGQFEKETMKDTLSTLEDFVSNIQMKCKELVESINRYTENVTEPLEALDALHDRFNNY